MRMTIGPGARRTAGAVLISITLIGIFLAAASCRAGGAAGEDPGGPQVYTGRIKSGFMGAGGEHTGWMLLRGGKEPDLEADVSAVMVKAKELDGQVVKASGTLYEKVYVERGTVKILKIDSLAPAPGAGS